MRFTRAQLAANSAVLTTFDLFIARTVGAFSVVVLVNVSIDFGLRQTKTECLSTSTRKKRRKDKEKEQVGKSKLSGQENY